MFHLAKQLTERMSSAVQAVGAPDGLKPVRVTVVFVPSVCFTMYPPPVVGWVVSKAKQFHPFIAAGPDIDCKCGCSIVSGDRRVGPKSRKN